MSESMSESLFEAVSKSRRVTASESRCPREGVQVTAPEKRCRRCPSRQVIRVSTRARTRVPASTSLSESVSESLSRPLSESSCASHAGSASLSHSVSDTLSVCCPVGHGSEQKGPIGHVKTKEQERILNTTGTWRGSGMSSDRRRHSPRRRA